MTTSALCSRGTTKRQESVLACCAWETAISVKMPPFSAGKNALKIPWKASRAVSSSTGDGACEMKPHGHSKHTQRRTTPSPRAHGGRREGHRPGAHAGLCRLLWQFGTQTAKGLRASKHHARATVSRVFGTTELEPEQVKRVVGELAHDDRVKTLSLRSLLCCT